MTDPSPLVAHVLVDGEEPHDPSAVPPSGRPTCANCGAGLAGRYCADCGQLDQPLRLPVHRFLAQSFNEFFGLDGRVWTTLGVLLFKPGKLTAEFLRGRRRRYLRPLRVYLTSTLVFFVLLALLDPVGRIEASVTGGAADTDSTVVVGERLAEVEARIAGEPERVARAEARADALRARADSLRASPTPAADEAVEEALEAAADGARDALDVREGADDRLDRLRLEAAVLGALPPDSTVRLGDLRAASAQIYPETDSDINLPGWLAQSESVQRIREARTSREQSEAGLSFVRGAVGHVPTVLFLILPVFALLLKALYLRRGWYYSEHLVFGLHTHAFAFCVFTVVALLSMAGGGAGGVGTVALVLLWSIPLYFLLAQKRVYGQGWVKTVGKAVVLGTAYVMVLSVGIAGVLLLAAAIG